MPRTSPASSRSWRPPGCTTTRASGCTRPGSPPRVASAAGSSPFPPASSESPSSRRRSTTPATASAPRRRSPTSRTRSEAIPTPRSRSDACSLAGVRGPDEGLVPALQGVRKIRTVGCGGARMSSGSRGFRRRIPLLGAAALACFGATATTASAQKQSKPPAKSLSTRVAEQKKEIEAQKLRIDEQRALIESQQAVADSQSVRIRTLEAELAAMQQRLADLESQAGLTALEERLKQIEAAAKKSPELPPEVVSAGDFPGSIRIPGTDAAVKFGGRIRTSVVLTLDPLGTDDRFLTNSIPVGGGETSGESKRTNISARASRLNLEFRTPSGREELRAFFEGDFAGSDN